MSRLKLLLAGLSFALVIIVPNLASADVNDFTVNNFKADETLSREDPQGELRIVERINVNFTDYNHGILRAIPDSYKHHSLQIHINKVSSDTGAPASYTTYGSNGNTVLKIGDPDRTVTGTEEYTIDYTLRNVISFYKDHDELYWDINGDQWQQPFDEVDVTVHLPTGLQASRQPLCYTGSYGSTSRQCEIFFNPSNAIQAMTTAALSAGQTLTIVAGFQPGYFHPSKWYETLGEYSRQLVEFFVPVIILGGGSLAYWWLRGRDPKGSGIIIPQYEAPDNFKPIEVGVLMNFGAENRDITATLIDLAVRGYLKIIESKQPHKLRKDNLDYTLELTNDRLDDLESYEKALLNALFDMQITAGRQVNLSEGKLNFAPTAGTVKDQITDKLTVEGYFRGNPRKTGAGLGIIAIIVGLILFYFGHFIGVAAVAGSIIGAVITFLSSSAADARTAKGVEAKEHILGLKLYLNVAEKDRLEKLQGPDAEYAANTAEPKKTVKLFEKLLPYAMVLGVEKQWANQFQDLYKTPPDWYSGTWTTFNAYYLVSSLNTGIGSAVNTTFSAPSSSNSSGFGGGFSGGGGGGGGGGGW